MKKCNRINCPEYSSKCEGNCTLRKNVEDCLDLTQNFVFDLEWIPVTDKEKPEKGELIAIANKKAEKSVIGKFESDYLTNRIGTMKGFTHWARITLPGGR